MNNNEVALTESDISASVFALSKVKEAHEYLGGIPMSQQKNNISLASSASRKLLLGEQLSNNEIRILASCLGFCSIICESKDDYPELYKECEKHISSINKLDAIFSEIIDKHL